MLASSFTCRSAASAAPAVDSGFVPPTATFLQEDFSVVFAGIPDGWQVEEGFWAASNGTYSSTLSGFATATTTIFTYQIDPNAIPQS